MAGSLNPETFLGGVFQPADCDTSHASRIALQSMIALLPAIDFQFLTRCSAVRHESACIVRVGLRARWVPITRSA